jgi:hypothetical protein
MRVRPPKRTIMSTIKDIREFCKNIKTSPITPHWKSMLHEMDEYEDDYSIDDFFYEVVDMIESGGISKTAVNTILKHFPEIEREL